MVEARARGQFFWASATKKWTIIDWKVNVSKPAPIHGEQQSPAQWPHTRIFPGQTKLVLQPRIVIEGPSGTEAVPRIVMEGPSSTEAVPRIVIEGPSGTEAVPRIVTEGPSGTEAVPRIVIKGPSRNEVVPRWYRAL